MPNNHEAVYLEWLIPNAHESLQSYAKRLSGKINNNEPFILVGLSFGGMVATEISKFLSPEKIILIASISSPEQLPKYYRLASLLRLYRIVPVSVIKSTSLLKRFFTTESEEDKTLLRDMVKKTDPTFIRWAMEAILHWRTDTVPPAITHIHGNADRILPLRNTHPTHAISNAGHLMILNRAPEINIIIEKLFNEKT